LKRILRIRTISTFIKLKENSKTTEIENMN
jgi:hypothetical protein